MVIELSESFMYYINMKLYKFSWCGMPNGTSFNILEESPQAAFDILMNYLRTKATAKRIDGFVSQREQQDLRSNLDDGADDYDEKWTAATLRWDDDGHIDDYERWRDATIDNLPKPYKLEVIEKGQVMIEEHF